MSLNKSLNSVEALYRKLERESYRAYHERDRIHKEDHFYNFCITANALRDYFFERKSLLQPSQKQPYYDLWNNNEFLVAATEIANTAKHFTLRILKTGNKKKIKTQKLQSKKSVFLDIYKNKNGELSTVFVLAPDCQITLESGAKYDLYMFTEEVLKYWYEFLRSESIPVRKQPLKRLIGERT